MRERELKLPAHPLRRVSRVSLPMRERELKQVVGAVLFHLGTVAPHAGA